MRVLSVRFSSFPPKSTHRPKDDADLLCLVARSLPSAKCPLCFLFLLSSVSAPKSLISAAQCLLFAHCPTPWLSLPVHDESNHPYGNPTVCACPLSVPLFLCNLYSNTLYVALRGLYFKFKLRFAVELIFTIYESALQCVETAEHTPHSSWLLPRNICLLFVSSVFVNGFWLSHFYYELV